MPEKQRTKPEGLPDLQWAIVEFVRKQKETTDSENNYHTTIWNRCYRMWLRWRKSRATGEERKSRLFIPLVFNMIELLLPLMMLTLFAVREVIEVLPTTDEDQSAAKVIKKLLAFQFPRIPNWFLKLAKWVKSILMYGTGVLKFYFTDERKEVPKIITRRTAGIAHEPEYEQDKDGNLITKKVGYFGPNFEFVPLDMFRKDPFADTIKDARWIRDVRERSMKYLQNTKDPATGENLYKNLDIVKKLAPSFDLNTGKDDKTSAKGRARPHNETTDEFCKIHELGDYWGVMPRKFLYWQNEEALSELSEEKKEEIVDGNIVDIDLAVPILVRENNYDLFNGENPYIYAIDYIDMEDFYGEGEISPVESHQHEINNNRNQWLEAMRRSTNRRKYINRTAGWDEWALENAPDGGLVRTNDIEGIKEEEARYDFTMPFQREDIIKNDFRETSGMYPQIGAEQPGKDQKATIYLSFERAVLKKFKFKAMLIENMGISEIGRWMMILNARYLTEDFEFKVFGESYTATVDEVQRQFDYRSIGSASEPLASLEARQVNLMTLFKTYAELYGVEGMGMDSWNKDIFEAFGIRDYKEKLSNPINLWFNNFKRLIAEMVEQKMPPDEILLNILKIQKVAEPNRQENVKTKRRNTATPPVTPTGSNDLQFMIQQMAGKFAKENMQVRS